MEKTYERINFENSPSKQTPLNEENMNRIDSAINEIDNRVVDLANNNLYIDVDIYTIGDKLIPLLIIDTAAKTAVVNPDYLSQSNTTTRLYSIRGIKQIDFNTLVIDTAKLGTNFNVYYNADTNTIKFTSGTTFEKGLYRLGYWFSDKLFNIACSLIINGKYYKYGKEAYSVQMPLLKQTDAFIDYSNINTDSEIFTVDFDNGSASITDKASSISLYTPERTYSVNLSTATIEVEKAAPHYCVLYNTQKNKFILDNFNNPNHDDCLYLGLISKEANRSTCILPYKTNGTTFYFKDRTGRIEAKLLLAYMENFGTKKIPHIDFDEGYLVIPGGVNVYAVYGRTYTSICSADSEIRIPFDTSERYLYLVGSGQNRGLKFVYGDFSSGDSAYDVDSIFYFGFVDVASRQINLNFECGIGKSVSVLGDSISTYQGYIPEENAVFYSGSNCGVSNVGQTWWKRTIDALGYNLNTNNSWSGDRVTNHGITRASELDNGTSPDIILVYLGINDFRGNVALGTYDGKGAFPTTTTTFREGYAVMLDNIMQAYPTAKVYCMTLPTFQGTFDDDAVHPEVNGAGIYLFEYNEAIRDIAKAMGAALIETASCGITNRNGSVYMGDYKEADNTFLHPNAAGHELIADAVIKALK